MADPSARPARNQLDVASSAKEVSIELLNKAFVGVCLIFSPLDFLKYFLMMVGV
jgi:hypothetical protein